MDEISLRSTCIDQALKMLTFRGESPRKDELLDVARAFHAFCIGSDYMSPQPLKQVA